MADAPRRILVVQTAFLGDVVLTTPLFRALRRIYPGARLEALVTPEAAPLLEEDPYLDEVLPYAKKSGEGFVAGLQKIKARHFDLLLAPHRSHRTALLSLLSRVPLRVGFADAGFARCYHRRVPRPLKLHEVDRNLELLRGVGAGPVAEDRVLHVGYTPAEAARVDAVLSGAGVGPCERLAGLCPGSVWATKRWTPEGFAAVGRGLRERGYRVVILGGPGDREAAEAVCAGIGPGAVQAVGTTPLKALAAWMDRLELLVTNDSSPVHVAAARGTPTVAVFGPTTRALGFTPFHTASRVVEVDLECRPCGLHGGKACPRGHFRCMGDVAPEALLKACDELAEEVALTGGLAGRTVGKHHGKAVASRADRAQGSAADRPLDS
ncbi:MAG: glycosyltransferase family 9 protein [Deferrisomatales bacterium]|nr:glycosyltransferase family 9 protein [Deferrisomatales bacterium]